jgi:isoleucyl-tRNA synthetase
MGRLRALRGDITTQVEGLRKAGVIGSSLQAQVTLPDAAGLDEAAWAEIAIVSKVTFGAASAGVGASAAPGEKCVRCWKILEEVGQRPAHPQLCLRCADAVASGLVGQPKVAA